MSKTPELDIPVKEDSDEEKDSEMSPSYIEPEDITDEINIEEKDDDIVDDIVDDDNIVDDIDKEIKESEEEETDDDEEDEDFKKFEQDIKKDLLIDFHPQMKQISHKEMLTLCKITRDKRGNIIDPLHQTIPFLTKFEKAKIIGLRAKQINNGADPFIDVPNNMIEGLTIAEKELEEKKVPFIIRRPLPNGSSEYWKVKDLEML